MPGSAISSGTRTRNTIPGSSTSSRSRIRTNCPDTLSLSVTIDDKVLKGVIKRLYYPETPYLFSVIPPAILGHVYEQFLGKVIRLTDGHQAKVEYKPEVKKAGGVFYTPQYIVEYIVKHTVGELTKGKTPRDVAKLRILDPACGSGSFLIGAYQFLLDWHRDWYIANLVPVFKEKNSATDPAVLALLPEAAPTTKKKFVAGRSPGLQGRHKRRCDPDPERLAAHDCGEKAHSPKQYLRRRYRPAGS